MKEKTVHRFIVGKEYNLYRYTTNCRKIKLSHRALCVSIGKMNERGEKEACFIVGRKKMRYTISQAIQPGDTEEVACHVAAAVNPLAVERMIGGVIRASEEVVL